MRSSNSGFSGRIPVLVLAVLLASACNRDKKPEGPGAGAPAADKKIALLLPESKTARYESHDRPLFERKVKALCPDCQLIYSNADQNAARQQDQAEAALTNGATVNGKVNNGKKDVPSILLTPVAVTRENVKSTVVADGFWTAAQLCTGAYQQACESAQLR